MFPEFNSLFDDTVMPFAENICLKYYMVLGFVKGIWLILMVFLKNLLIGSKISEGHELNTFNKFIRSASL